MRYARDARATPGEAYAREPGTINELVGTEFTIRVRSTLGVEPTEQECGTPTTCLPGGWFGGESTAT